MADYIDRAEAIASLVEYYNSMKDFVGYGTPKKNAVGECIERLKNDIPSADVVEVVRCKDCRWGREACGNIECRADMSVPPEYHGYDWFCPNGERK